jgi:hypothetical protein
MLGAGEGEVAQTGSGGDSGGGALSGIGGAVDGNGIMDAIQAVGSMVNSIMGYCFQKDIIDIQKQMMQNRISHQERMAKKDMDASLDTIKKQEENLLVTRDMQAAALKAKEEVKKEECKGEIIAAERKENKLTEKHGAINERQLNRVFDTRGTYQMGTPKVPKHLIETSKYLK